MCGEGRSRTRSTKPSPIRKDHWFPLSQQVRQFVAMCPQEGLLAKASVPLTAAQSSRVEQVRDNNFKHGNILAPPDEREEEGVARAYMSQTWTRRPPRTARRREAVGNGCAGPDAAYLGPVAKGAEEVKRWPR